MIALCYSTGKCRYWEPFFAHGLFRSRCRVRGNTSAILRNSASLWPSSRTRRNFCPRRELWQKQGEAIPIEMQVLYLGLILVKITSLGSLNPPRNDVTL